MGLVADIPIWSDCPYRVSHGMEVRRGVDDGCELVIIANPKNERHVDFSAWASSQALFDSACERLISDRWPAA